MLKKNTCLKKKLHVEKNHMLKKITCWKIKNYMFEKKKTCRKNYMSRKNMEFISYILKRKFLKYMYIGSAASDACWLIIQSATLMYLADAALPI